MPGTIDIQDVETSTTPAAQAAAATPLVQVTPPAPPQDVPPAAQNGAAQNGAAQATPPPPATPPPARDAKDEEDRANQQRQQDQDPTQWYDALDESTRGQVNAWHENQVTSMRAALSTERGRATQFEKDVKRLTKLAEEGTELRTQLEQLQGNLQQENQRVEFYENAITQGVRRTALRLAFLAAQDGGFIDGRGNVNWNDLRSTHGDALFEPVVRAPSHAGTGLGGPPPAPARNANDTMNDRLRNARRG